MSYPKKLLRLRPTKGIVVDTPPYEVGADFYTAGNNVIFRGGFAQRIGGFRNAYTTALGIAAPGDLLHALNAQFAGTNFWLLFEADGTAWAIEGDNATQIDGALLSAITQPWPYASALLNGIPIVCNGSDEPVFWPGTGNLTTLTDWTATETAGSIAVFKFHIFAMDIDGPSGTFPSLVKWSAAAAPGTIPSSWTPGAGNEAGSVELSDGPGPVLCAVPLRDNLIFYKRSTTYAAQYVAGNLKYAFAKLQSASGALTRHAVCDVHGQHLVVSEGDIVLTDGTNLRSIGESRMKDFLFNQLDQDNFENLFTVFHPAKNEALIGFPSSGVARPNLALVYDVAQDSFGIRDLPSIATAAIGTVNDTTPSNTWASRSDTWADAHDKWGSSEASLATGSLVFLAVDDLIQQDTPDAQTVGATVGKHDIHFGEPERVKFVRRVHVRAEQGFGTLLVRVGSRMTPNDVIDWSNEVTLTEPEQIVNVFAQGRYISVEIRSNGTEVWTVTGFDLEAELRGYF